MSLTKLARRNRAKKRSKGSIFGSVEKLRLSVFKSNKEIYAQLIDDLSGTTLVSVSSRDKNFERNGNKINLAVLVGNKLAESAKSKGIENVVFDRNGFLYHGRIKALADAAREGGLKF